MFSPVSSNLGQANEYSNINYAITYTDLLLGSFPVTLTQVDSNSTVTVTGNLISGYYSDTFSNSILYRTLGNDEVNVQKFEQIDYSKFDQLIKYQADPTQVKEFQYIAEANGESKIYSIFVTNNWTPGRNEVLRITNLEEFNSKSVDFGMNWVNTSGNKINWMTDI